MPPSRWQAAQFLNRIGATSSAYVGSAEWAESAAGWRVAAKPRRTKPAAVIWTARSVKDMAAAWREGGYENQPPSYRIRTPGGFIRAALPPAFLGLRSEEHTSELQ